jgi:hypothetical protein
MAVHQQLAIATVAQRKAWIVIVMSGAAGDPARAAPAPIESTSSDLG